VKGFALFIDPKKANCAACHSGANFTDNSFHNLGLASFGKDNPTSAATRSARWPA